MENLAVDVMSKFASMATEKKETTSVAAPSGSANSLVAFLKKRNGPRTQESFIDPSRPWFAKLTSDEKLTLILASRKHSLDATREAELVAKYKEGPYGERAPSKNFEALSKKLMAIVKKEGVVAPTQWNVVQELLKADCIAIHTEMVLKYMRPEAPAVLHSDMVWTCVGFEKALEAVMSRFVQLTVTVMNARNETVSFPVTNEESEWVAWSGRVVTVATDARAIAWSKDASIADLFASAYVPRPHELRRTSQYKQKPSDATMNQKVIQVMVWMINLSRQMRGDDRRAGGEAFEWMWDPEFDGMKAYYEALQYLKSFARFIKKYPARPATMSYADRLAEEKSRVMRFNIKKEW